MAAASIRKPPSARWKRVCAELGLSLKIAVVEGDDVMPRIDALRGDCARGLDR